MARYFEQVLSGGDLAALDDLLAPDFRSWLPDGGSIGPGPYRDAVLASLLTLLQQLGIAG